MSARWMGMVIAVAAAVGVVGCGSSCPTEPPKTSDFTKKSCVASPGEIVPIPITLCPTCNQTLASCSANPPAGNSILLDPLVEACESGVCNNPPACDLPATCDFRAPMEPDTYTIQVVENPDAGQPVFWEATLQVLATSGTPGSCS